MPSRKKKADNSADKHPVSLETALDELNGIVNELESGQQPLSNALDRFERGMRLLKDCDCQLENAVRRIEIVRRMDEDGVNVEPFDAAATADQKPSESTDTAGSGNLF
ncbi:MAG: exodeoxyribonuclease VII small subunit [Fuerstiella sp.]|nr:exodeoxyribonuclease VII small subunit [Fuerstiella sp.]